VRKRQRRFEGFDEEIIALHSRGLSTRDIQAYVQDLYGVEVGRDLISRVTDAVMDDARAWATRPPEVPSPCEREQVARYRWPSCRPGPSGSNTPNP
jgi:putative transposase